MLRTALHLFCYQLEWREITSTVQDLTEDKGILSFDFLRLEESTSDVVIEFRSKGDLGYSADSHFKIVVEDSLDLGIVGGSTKWDSHCTTDFRSETFKIFQDDFNMLIADDDDQTLTIKA